MHLIAELLLAHDLRGDRVALTVLPQPSDGLNPAATVELNA